MSFQFIYNIFKCRQKLDRRAGYRQLRSAYCCLSLSCLIANHPDNTGYFHRLHSGADSPNDLNDWYHRGS